MDTLFAMAKQRTKEKTVKHDALSAQLGVEPKARRGRKPRLTRTEIANVAIMIAGSEGMQAVSMRRVAAELASGTASLYRYVKKKDELLDLMVDCVRGEERFPKLAADWRVNLRRIAHNTRDLALRHPWMMRVSPVRTALGVHSLRWWEFRLGILSELGLTIDEMIVMVNTLDNFVKGYAAAETAEFDQARSSGIEFKQWLNNNAQYVMSVVASREFPLFNRVVRDAKAPHDPKRAAHEFEAGVEHILNGFAGQIAQKASAPKSRRIALKQ